jgi:hypothetical protein
MRKLKTSQTNYKVNISTKNETTENKKYTLYGNNNNNSIKYQ